MTATATPIRLPVPPKGTPQWDTIELLLRLALEAPRRKNKWSHKATVLWATIEEARTHLKEVYGLDIAAIPERPMP